MANVLSTDKQIAVIGTLAEGSSLRSIERITGVHRDTIMRLGVCGRSSGGHGMTVEHKMVVGMDDIRALTIECLGCKSRTTILMDAIHEIPRACSHCNTAWWTPADAITGGVNISAPAAQGLVVSIRTLRTLIKENKNNYRLLLEFDEPNKP